MKNLLFSLNLFEGFNMKKYLVYLIMTSTLLFTFVGCKKTTTEPDAVDQYPQKITDAWAAYSLGNYDTAKNLFLEAKSLDVSKGDAYMGLGWCYLKSDSVNLSLSNFSIAYDKGLCNADLNSGYAFSLNAAKQYQLSNSYAEIVLVIKPNWVFTYQTTLNKNDLLLLKAQNFFQLGDFANSLSYVKMLNISFLADVSTAAGRSALADEIERLKNII